MVEPAPPGSASPPGLDLSHPRRVHIVGIGGAGMSAIATVLAAMGHRVTGSDLKSSPALERLRTLAIVASVGHDPANLGSADVVTISTAVPATNVEVVAARAAGLPVLRRAETLAAIAATRRSIAVAGTHGKTTTSSMLALILVEGGLRPSFLIGGDINEVGSGAVWNPDGELLVVEADESDGTFLELDPAGVMVTNVEPDHLDFYGGMAELRSAFARFLAQGRVEVVCADDPVAAELGRAVGAVGYGTTPGADYLMADVELGRSWARFQVRHQGQDLGQIELAVPGLHNARNACGALVMGLAAGVSFEAARRALRRYGGVARRFEFRGEAAGVTYVDDYAHLPGEVGAVLAAARAGHWERIVAVFQPHRYSRLAALWADFADAFVDADLLVVTEVYSAGEAPRPGVSGQLIVDAVKGAHPNQDAIFLPGHQELVAYLRSGLRPGDVCLTLGAGDLTALPGELLDEAD